MATSEPDIKTKIAELRHEILSYKPGKAVPCADELIVFPDRLVIGVIDAVLPQYIIISALRRALYGDVERIKYADRRETSTEGQEKYLTDSISVIERIYNYSGLEQVEKDLKDLVAKVGCFVVLNTPRYPDFNREAARKIREITGRYPIVGLWNDNEEDVKLERKRLRKEGIVEVHEIPWHDHSHSDTEQLQLLNLLHGCLGEGDEILANKDLKELCMNPSLLRERAKKEITGNQKMIEEIRQHERVEESLQQEMKRLQMKLEESSVSRESLVNENARLKKEIVREKQKREQAELAMTENDKIAQNSQEMYKQTFAKLEKELKTKEQHIKEQEEKYKEREERARHEVERMKTEKGEERARFEKEKLSVESALKNELKSEKERVEQLERESWKLRTKIQLESEIRSAEQKKKVETPRWSFIPWIVSGKQTRTDQSPSEDRSREGLGESDAMQTGEEPPNDDFADILKQIADDLSDDAKIDSLGGQLGILQGDIDRALKTNMRYEQITSRGTYLMLKQWRRSVSREDERIALRRALEAAKLLNIADRYLPQEGSTASDHSKIAEDPHRLSREYGTASKQGSSKESPKHSIDDKQYAPEDIMTSGGESEDAAEVTGTDQPKLEDSHGHSGKDGPPLGQGSSRGQTEVEETRATIERSSPGDTSYMNEEEQCEPTV